jgi:hypothetical protein
MPMSVDVKGPIGKRYMIIWIVMIGKNGVWCEVGGIEEKISRG